MAVRYEPLLVPQAKRRRAGHDPNDQCGTRRGIAHAGDVQVRLSCQNVSHCAVPVRQPFADLHVAAVGTAR